MKNKLTYFIARSYMFGIGSFLIFKYTGKDAWIAIILGTLLGIIVLYLYDLLKQEFQNHKIKYTLKKTFVGKLYIVILIIFYLFLMVVIITLLSMFVNSFYLIYTPKILINIPFLFLALYITKKGKRVLESLSSLLCVISILIMVIYALFLTKYISVSELLPVFTTKSMSIIKASLVYASVTSIPQILTLNYDGDFKTNLKNYSLASIFSLMVTIITIMSMGETLIKMYSFPEYAVLKQIKILDFIENVENISSFIWYFDMFITLSTLSTNLHGILPKTYKKVYFYGICLLALIISSYFVGKNYRITITMFTFYPLILAGFLVLFIILLIYLKIKKKITHSSN